MIKPRKTNLIFSLLSFLLSCQTGEVTDPIQDPETEIYRIPVVVHVIHLGEEIGTGHNLSKERIENQIRTLNEDYRRKKGSSGFNTHPDGGDAMIEFFLANTAPDGTATDGIIRIDAYEVKNPVEPSHRFDYYAYYSYWNPEKYVNVWTEPLPEITKDVVLGSATGPETDLPGAELFIPGEPVQAEGILINSWHFGESNIDSDYNLGRTLTHEIGHYLGLLHTWGGGDCETNDYCSDTPPVDSPVLSCNPGATLTCDGQAVMVENYMNYSPDQCMNIFTKDQIERMHYVLENSPRRKTLYDPFE